MQTKRAFLLLLVLCLLASVSLFAIYKPKNKTSHQPINEIFLPKISEVQSSTLTLQEVFDGKVNLANHRPLSLIATGDVMLGRTVNFKTVTQNDFTWSFNNVSDMLRAADIAIINLEGSLTENCQLTNNGMQFCGDTRHIEGLTFAGIDIANLANNHIANFGEGGIETTKKLLDEAHILYTGTPQPTYKKVQETTFAFLGYNSIPPDPEGINWAINANIMSDIHAAKEKSDIVVVSFHWGNEYTSQPTNQQIDLAHTAIDAGADIIIGHHPHWIQPIEIYQGKIIFYSLGNFIFDQMWSQKTREGLVAQFFIDNREVVDINLIPIIIEDFGQPRIANQEEQSVILSNIRNKSQESDEI